MAEFIKLVQGDTAPTLVVTLTDKLADDAPINITGASVKLRFKQSDSDELIDTLDGVVLDGPAGLCKFDWKPTSLTNVNEGLHLGEVEITFADGGIQTAFDLLRFVVRTEF